MTPKEIKERFTGNDRAVSPVIGVILMVAITVILAAVIGTFVLDLGQSAGDRAPSASLTVDTDASNNVLNVSHKGGDALDSSQTRIVITNETAGSESVTLNATSGSNSFSVGNQIGIHRDNANVTSGPWAGMSDSTPANPDGLDINSGEQYSIQVIDLESQRVIFETTVTA